MVDKISSTVSGVRQQLGLPDTDTAESVSRKFKPNVSWTVFLILLKLEL